MHLAGIKSQTLSAVEFYEACVNKSIKREECNPRRNPQKIMFILQKLDGESTYNKLFFEIKKGLFQTEKELFTDELKYLIAF